MLAGTGVSDPPPRLVVLCGRTATLESSLAMPREISLHGM